MGIAAVWGPRGARVSGIEAAVVTGQGRGRRPGPRGNAPAAAVSCPHVHLDVRLPINERESVMSVVSNRMRLHVLAAATAVAVSAIATPAFAGKLNLSGLEAGAKYDRFIVKYRDGSVERADAG